MQSNTNTSISPLTGVSTSPLDSTGTQGAVNFAIGNQTSTDASTDAASPEINQANARLAAAKVLGQGAMDAATKGALACEEGANASLSNPLLGGALLNSCLHSFDSAASMKALEDQSLKNTDLSAAPVPLAFCSSSLSSSVGDSISDDFQKNYGIPGDEFTSALLNARGNPNTLASQLKGKLPPDRLFKLLGEAANLSPGEIAQLVRGTRVSALPTNQCSYEYNLAAGGSKKKLGLRDSLKKKIAEAAEEREPASADAESANTIAETEDLKFKGLEPLRDGIFGQKDSSPGMTLFDVVHIKYVELRGRWRNESNLGRSKSIN